MTSQQLWELWQQAVSIKDWEAAKQYAKQFDQIVLTVEGK